MTSFPNAIPPRILVCGGRDYKDKVSLYTYLDGLCEEREWHTGIDPLGPDKNWLPYVHVISGKAKGADTLAVDWAVTNWCSYDEYPAQWDKYGKSAGYKRNAQMLEEGKPDLVVAFPGGVGTAMMVKIARAAGVETIVVG